MLFEPKIVTRNYRIQNGLIPVREDEVELESGDRYKYTVLEYHNAAVVVALTPDNRIPLVRVPRYPINQYLWELPGGRVDGSETPEQCALREVEEETGYSAASIELLTTYYPEPSFSTERLDVFLATELTETGRAIPESEGLCRVKLFQFDDAVKMVLSGEIKSSWSIIGVLFAATRLKSMGRT